MSAWVKPAASSSDVIVVQNGGDGGGVPCNGYSLGLNNLTVTGYHPCVAFLSSGATVPQANQWIFLTMVKAIRCNQVLLQWCSGAHNIYLRTHYPGRCDNDRKRQWYSFL